jgi:hypothetical protein
MLTPDTLRALLLLRDCPLQSFRIPDRIWARLLYDIASAYHREVMPQEHLLKALTPLYLGRTASFVLETQGLTTPEAEQRIEALCDAFELEKPYLCERWKEGANSEVRR